MKNICLLIVAVVLFSLHVNAQSSIIATGGEATENGGIVSFSIGQIAVQTNGDGVTTISEGVQHPYEISVSGVDNYPTITLNLTVGTPAFACGTSTLTDVDGNTYNTFQIGEQCWMKENLRTTKKPNGSTISSGIWAPGNNSIQTYGRLYSWATVMNGASSSNANPSGVQGICPDGWHVPSDNEWKQMEMAMGMSQSDANDTEYRSNIAAKLSCNTGWSSSSTANAAGNLDTPDRNSSGFSALPAGYYGSNHVYFGSYAGFWSATERNSDNAYYRGLYYNYAGVGRDDGNKSTGYSVRCVRD